MNVVFISVLTFSDLDIALSNTADMFSFLARGLLPALNYTPVTVLVALFTVACLCFPVAMNTSQEFTLNDLCMYERHGGHAQTVLFILGSACTQVDVPVTSSSF